MLNSKKIAAVLAACGMLSLMSACAPLEGRETAGAYVDDSTITGSVKADLVKDQSLKAFDIHVETMNGVVQLSGFVDKPIQKSDAERIATTEKGVRAVHNNVLVRVPGSSS